MMRKFLCVGEFCGSHRFSDKLLAFLSLLVALSGSDVEPCVCLHIVLWYTFTLGIHASQKNLSFNVSLLCGPAKPPCCFNDIFRNTKSV